MSAKDPKRSPRESKKQTRTEKGAILARALGAGQKAESRKNTQEIREKLEAPKCPPEFPKTSPREPKMAQNGAKSAPRRPRHPAGSQTAS